MVNVCGAEIKSGDCEKLLGTKIDSMLNFEKHLSNILTKTNRKTKALSRVMPYTNLSKKQILKNSFFMSQSSYCPLVWMFHNRTINNKINILHKKMFNPLVPDVH